MGQAFLTVVCDKTHKSGATGIDGQTAKYYKANLQDNLSILLNRFNSGSYKAPPFKRVYIPKDGVISPLLTNIYLHYVSDEWIHEVVKIYLKENEHLYRYADDFIICFENETDARRIMKILPKRFAKFGLELHPEKTRLIYFNTPDDKGPDDLPVSDDKEVVELNSITNTAKSIRKYFP
ncbi:hypothetical protein JW979_11075 [bacterium]|nr:hypothetical protein [candidate division CSSED10-310 bacterium]